MEGVLPWIPLSDPRSSRMKLEISQAFGVLHELLLECLPSPPAGGNKTGPRGTAAWDDCVRHLRVAKTMLKEAGRKAGGMASGPPDIAFGEAQKAWDTGVHILNKMKAARTGFIEDTAAGSLLEWDGFHSDLSNGRGVSASRRLHLPSGLRCPVAEAAREAMRCRRHRSAGMAWCGSGTAYCQEMHGGYQ